MDLITPSGNQKNFALIRLLGYVYVEPHVLRSHRETFSWLNNATRVLWYSASWSIMVVGVRAQQPTSLAGPLSLTAYP